MKKHIFGYSVLLLIICTFCLGCEKEEPVKAPRQDFAKVVPVDMPEFFEVGKSYSIEVVYNLPSSCHTPYGLGIERMGNSPEGLRQILVTGIAILDTELTCNEENDVDLEIQDSFFVSIDQDQSYTFHFWAGMNENNEHIFTKVEVPVRSPESNL